MANGNTVTVVGNLTRDPELRYTPSGASNTRFGVAVNRRFAEGVAMAARRFLGDLGHADAFDRRRRAEEVGVHKR